MVVQELLDKGYSISEISDILDVKHGTIQGLINNKKIKLPNNYKNKILNFKPIVRLSKDGEFISRFNTLSDADKQGFASGTVIRVLKKKQSFSYDSFWLYEEDYLNKNYIIPEKEFDHFTLSVDKYNMNDEFICSYDSIYEAEKDSVSSRTEIYRVAKGDRKSSRNEKWKFKEVA